MPGRRSRTGCCPPGPGRLPGWCSRNRSRRASFDDLVAEVSLAQLSAQRSDAPPAQLAAQRLSARHAELRQAAATGLWKVRVVAGGPSPSAAAQIAGLLCASTDLEGLPYALAPVPGCAGLAESLRVHAELTQRAPLPRARDEPDIPAPAAPFYASSRLVAALARPPARELPGIRFVLRPDFDVTPETGGQSRGDGKRAAGAGGDGAGLEPGAGRGAGCAAGVAEPARVRVRGDRGGEVPDRPGPAGGGHRGGDPVAGGRAGQGRVPADGRPAARHAR